MLEYQARETLAAARAAAHSPISNTCAKQLHTAFNISRRGCGTVVSEVGTGCSTGPANPLKGRRNMARFGLRDFCLCRLL